jgi:hypothetical protein
MGLFGGQSVYVSSSVYNLAGDEADRPNFLKSSIYSAVMNNNNPYLGEVIVGNYITGPGILQRSFYNYAIRNNLSGLPSLTVRNTVAVDPVLVSQYILVPSTPVGVEIKCQSAEITDGDFSYWAEKWLYENNPSAVNTQWLCDYNEVTNEITVQYSDGTTDIFSGTNYDKEKQYIIARYYQNIPEEVLPLVVGNTTYNTLTPPDVSEYSLTNTTNTGIINYSLNQTETVTKEYSDGSPTTTTITELVVDTSWDGIHREYQKTDYIGGDGTTLETSNLISFYHQYENREITNDLVGTDVVVINDLGNGVTETVTTNTSGEFLTPIYDWRVDTQEVVIQAHVGNTFMFIYEIGTGNAALDSLQSELTPINTTEYYPFIPLRLNNVSLLDPVYDNLYAESSSAYRKASNGQSLKTLIDEIELNPDIGDIDYSYVQWGVSVNTTEASCLNYMYEFFRNLILNQNTTSANITALKNSIADYDAAIVLQDTWTVAQTDPLNPLYNTPKPNTPNIIDPETTTIRLNSSDPSLGSFDNRYTWVSIEENSYTGTGKVGAVTGDIWFEQGETLTWSVQTGIVSRDGLSTVNSKTKTIEQIHMYKQTGVDTYSKLNIWGMIHNNFIYGGRSVQITLKDGINDLEPSAFIIPLHAPTIKNLGIVNFTQMATANTWITFNSYLVVKKKWYQTFFGMLFTIVAIVTASVLFAPAVLGSTSGILGVNSVVGTSFGLTGTAAIIAGAVTNAIAAIIVSQVIGKVSIEIFGEKWGSIISSIVNFAITFGVANGFDSLNLSNMIKPQNLLKMSSALANGYSGFVASNISDIQDVMSKNQSAYDKAEQDIEDLMASLGLVNDLSFNPLGLTDSVKGNVSNNNVTSYVPESLDQFINRTTMTGSDIVEFSLSMITDYAELQRTLPK